MYELTILAIFIGPVIAVHYLCTWVECRRIRKAGHQMEHIIKAGWRGRKRQYSDEIIWTSADYTEWDTLEEAYERQVELDKCARLKLPDSIPTQYEAGAWR